MKFEAACSATAIGSLPHTDPRKAMALILETTPEIPYWPQLTQRSFSENMYVQYAYALPNAVIDKENKKFYIEKREDAGSMKAIEDFLVKLVEGNVDAFAYDTRYFSGFYAFLDARKAIQNLKPKAVKGHITGPISLGLQLTDRERKSLLYDDVYRDILIKNLKMSAAWQEKKLKEICDTTIISVDEPYLNSFGSAYLSLERADAIRYMKEVFSSVSGLKATHCCGNTDWSMLFECGIDILFFDAYQYAERLALYADDVAAFIADGGVLGFGLVPSTEEEFVRESKASLLKKFDGAVELFTRKGIDEQELLAHALLTPSCGVGGTMSVENATKALRLLKELSDEIKKKME